MRGSCYLVPPLATHVSPYVSVELVGTPPLGASEHSCYLVTPLSEDKGGVFQNDSSITFTFETLFIPYLPHLQLYLTLPLGCGAEICSSQTVPLT